MRKGSGHKTLEFWDYSFSAIAKVLILGATLIYLLIILIQAVKALFQRWFVVAFIWAVYFSLILGLNWLLYCAFYQPQAFGGIPKIAAIALGVFFLILLAILIAYRLLAVFRSLANRAPSRPKSPLDEAP